jgi:hypothetical protein
MFSFSDVANVASHWSLGTYAANKFMNNGGGGGGGEGENQPYSIGKDPLMGPTIPYTGFGKEYGHLKSNLLWDPALRQGAQKALDIGSKDYMGLGKSMALRGADTATQGITNALSARGGGNIGAASTLGSQNRIGAALQGLTTGVQLDSAALGALNEYLQTKWGILTALYGKQAAFQGAKLGAKAQEYSADQGAMAQIVSSLIQGQKLSGG